MTIPNCEQITVAQNMWHLKVRQYIMVSKVGGVGGVTCRLPSIYLIFQDIVIELGGVSLGEGSEVDLSTHLFWLMSFSCRKFTTLQNLQYYLLIDGLDFYPCMLLGDCR